MSGYRKVKGRNCECRWCGEIIPLGTKAFFLSIYNGDAFVCRNCVVSMYDIHIDDSLEENVKRFNKEQEELSAIDNNL
jgi:hypothetical protein